MIIQPTDGAAKNGIDLDDSTASIVFAIPEGVDWIVAQLTAQAAWTASAIVTLEISLDGQNWSNFPSGAVTYTASGVAAILTVTGIRFIRYRVSTSQVGDATVYVTVNGGRDE